MYIIEEVCKICDTILTRDRHLVESNGSFNPLTEISLLTFTVGNSIYICRRCKKLLQKRCKLRHYIVDIDNELERLSNAKNKDTISLKPSKKVPDNTFSYPSMVSDIYKSTSALRSGSLVNSPLASSSNKANDSETKIDVISAPSTKPSDVRFLTLKPVTLATLPSLLNYNAAKTESVTKVSAKSSSDVRILTFKPILPKPKTLLNIINTTAKVEGVTTLTSSNIYCTNPSTTSLPSATNNSIANSVKTFDSTTKCYTTPSNICIVTLNPAMSSITPSSITPNSITKVNSKTNILAKHADIHKLTLNPVTLATTLLSSTSTTTKNYAKSSIYIPHILLKPVISSTTTKPSVTTKSTTKSSKTSSNTSTTFEPAAKRIKISPESNIISNIPKRKIMSTVSSQTNLHYPVEVVSDTKVYLTVKYPSCEKYKTLDKEFNKIGVNLMKGCYKDIAKSFYNHQAIKEFVILLVEKDIKKECEKMCSLKDGKSILKKTKKEELSEFTFDKLEEEMKLNCPMLRTFLMAACIRTNVAEEKNSFWKHTVCMAASLCLKKRSKRMTAVQAISFNSLISENS